MQLASLLDLLNQKYLCHYQTKILGGFDEPFYQAVHNNNWAQIQFSHDYIRSALHELAHWCVAGVERRKLDDYGYWYAQDGRNQQQQDEFFKLEVKPQAIEWAFSIMCGVDFEASVDNLDNQVQGVGTFESSVQTQLNLYLVNGFSKRVSEILKLLARQRTIASVENYILNAFN